MSTLETLQRLTGPNAPEGVDADMIEALEAQIDSNRRRPPQRGLSGVHQHQEQGGRARRSMPDPRR